MSIRYFEFIDDKSSKFWQIEQNDLSMIVTYGKIGTSGTEKIKDFDSEEEVVKAIEKLINEKTKKGYIEIASEEKSTNAVSVKVTTKQSPTTHQQVEETNNNESDINAEHNQTKGKEETPVKVQHQAKARPSNVAPWFKDTDEIVFDKSVQLKTLPTRQHPVAKSKVSKKTSFSKIIKLLISDNRYSLNKLIFDYDSTPYHLNLLENAFSRVNEANPEGDLISDAVLYALAATIPIYNNPHNNNECIVEFLIAKGGLTYAIDVFLKAQTYQIDVEYVSKEIKYKIKLSEDVYEPLGFDYGNQFSLAELSFVDWLSHADETTFKLCEEKLMHALDSLHFSRQPLIALLLPDNTELANQLAQNLIAENKSHYYSTMWLSLVATDEKSLKKLIKNKLLKSNYNDKIFNLILGTWFKKIGHKVADIVSNDITYFNEQVSKIILAFGVPSLIKVIAKQSNDDKIYRELLVENINTNPLAYFVAFVELTLENEASPFIKNNLEQILQQNIEDIPLIYPWVSEAVKTFTETLLAKHLKIQAAKENIIYAKNDELPKLLTSPPWLLSKKKSNPVIDVNPLESKDNIIDFDDSEIVNYLNDIHVKIKIEKEKSVQRILKNLGLRVESDNPERLINKIVQTIKNNQIQEMVQLLQLYKDNYYMNFNLANTVNLDDAVVLAIIENCHHFDFYKLDYLLYRFGTKAIHGIVELSKTKPSVTLDLWQYIASSKLAPIVAKAFSQQKTFKKAAMQWCLKYPEHCIIGLIPNALGKKSDAQQNAHVMLRVLAQNSHQQLILDIASRYQDKKIYDAVVSILNEDPLDLYPDKINPLPSFWQPFSWHRPRLKGTDRYLNDDALAHIGTMLQFPTNEGIYEGIKVIKNLFEGDSLANFAWDLFLAWQTADAPAKENWAFKALGILGNDDSARKLVPLIRQWPGESLHQRAVLGLDILEGIGSDVALMLLNGIAQKLKFKGLQDKAKEKIAEIAKNRNLSIDELEDRLAPTLGLDDDGVLILDFGPRQFKVSFDETLKPFVRDMDGVRLKDLPKPKQTDDKDKSTEAVNRFKALKKDAKLIASQEIYRLEKAMCKKRRWDVASFIELLVKHPVVRHLVNKLAWGIYEIEEDSYFGGQLVSTFRVAEDGTFTDVSDDMVELPNSKAVKIGLPHLLELSEQDKNAFSQLFSDYEIIQPFKQLDREIFELTETELNSHTLKRFNNEIVPSGRIINLKLKGWIPGEVLDGGMLDEYYKPISENVFIGISFRDGIYVGELSYAPEQTITECAIFNNINPYSRNRKNYEFSVLDKIDASEFIRDMMDLTAKKS